MKIKFENLAYKKLRFYIDNCDVEISGYGKSRIDNDEVIIEDICIIKQRCHATNTDIDDEATMLFFKSKMDAGDDVKSWNVWWHSHVNMGVFWSATDEKTAAEVSSGGDYLISIVGNKKGECLGRVDIFPKNKSPFKTQTNFHEKIEVLGRDMSLITPPEIKEAGDSIDKQIEVLTKQKEELIKNQLVDDPLELEIIQEIEDKVNAGYKETKKFEYRYGSKNNYNGYYGWDKNIYDYHGNNHSRKKEKEDTKDKLIDNDYLAYCPSCKIGTNIYTDINVYRDGTCPKCGANMLKEVQEVEFEIDNYWRTYKSSVDDIDSSADDEKESAITEDATVVCGNCAERVHLNPKLPTHYLCPSCSRDLLHQYNQDKKKRS